MAPGALGKRHQAEEGRRWLRRALGHKRRQAEEDRRWLPGALGKRHQAEEGRR